MAKKDKLIKSKSIYTIKKQHQKTNNGVIYENDHITIIPNDGIYDDEMALFSESNFKYRISTNSSSKKRHHRGDFIRPEDTESEVWTLENVNNSVNNSNESSIVLKPNYSSLKDFAYFGSAIELVKATINDVILRFPGGISYYGEDAQEVVVNDEIFYLVSNEFNIDCWTGGGLIDPNSVKNPMRILASSFMNYVNKDGEDCTCPVFESYGNICLNSIIGTVNFNAGDFYVYMDGEGKRHLLSKKKGGNGEIIIRPKQKFIDEFWGSMDDFERVLLNRESTPVYKAVFETPYFDGNNYLYEEKSYIWPTVGNDGFTPDMTTGAFQGYLESLISLASFHDEYDSDNIWRMMTHESIKNLDWTYTNKNNEEIEGDIENNGISSMIRIYGRQFDDIKRYADSIKNMINISYNEKNNVPDYFLSDIVNNYGWEAQHVAPFDNIILNAIEKDGKTVLYSSGKTTADVNTAFQRRLALNSTYINSLKGTRRGIEAIISLFGYKYNDSSITTVPGEFNINEYTCVSTSGLSYTNGSYLRGYVESIWETDHSHLMEGFPVAVIKPYVPEESITAERGEESFYYMVPWFDKSLLKKDFYFQCFGGWGKQKSKQINLPSLTDIKEIEGSTFSIYGETLSYMKFVDTIDEMLSSSHTELFENMVCYVTDISNIKNIYNPSVESSQETDYDSDSDDYSHYFILKNVALSTHCGFVSNDLYNCYGWKNIPNSEIREASTEDAIRVIYLETIITDYRGNNPHIGYGKYDDGSKYLEHFTTLFKDFFDRGEYEYMKEEHPEDYMSAATFGFKLTEQVDNKKCAYFEDYIYNDNPLHIVSNNADDDILGEEWNSSIYKNVKFPDTPVEINGPADETQANGVMNIKKMVINFGIGGNQHLKKYIQNVVFKYLESMIPSTTILEYRFDGEFAIEIDGGNAQSGSFTFLRTAHAAIDATDESITTWREYLGPLS